MLSIARCAVLAAALHFGLEPAMEAQSNYQRLKSFGSPELMGQSPRALLLQGSDGALYGTTRGGGGSIAGTVFRINPDGSGYHALHGFGTIASDGVFPSAGLVEASDGALYGTTYSGGSNVYYGTVFKLNKDGSSYSTLHSFGGSGDDGKNPYAGLIEGSDGALYGTTFGGGNSSSGTIFKINKNGSGYEILHSFSFNGPDGSLPYGGLMKGSDGALYGTAERGGGNSGGTVFKLHEDGSGYTVLHNFGAIANDWSTTIIPFR